MKILRFWFPALIYSGIIFYVSSVPQLETPVKIEHFDKLIHIIEYAILGFLVAYAVFNTNPSYSIRAVLIISGLLASFYGISDEYHQSFVQGRTSSVGDVISDSIGSFLGSYLYLKLTGKWS